MTQPLNLDSFLNRYVNTNVGPGSKPYDRQFLVKDLLGDLNQVDLECFEKMGFHLLVAMCCALKRADLVPSIFRDLTEEMVDTTNTMTGLFSAVRETINIIWPFVGVPQVIPACLGLAGYLQISGAVVLQRQRPDIGKVDTPLGIETRRSIYKASANSEVFEMLATYFGDFAHALNGIGFGYNIGRVDAQIFSLAESELIVTAALIGLGASRQAGSHIKACIAFGFSEHDVEAIVETAEKLANWQGVDHLSSKSSVDVTELARQARDNLKARW